MQNPHFSSDARSNGYPASYWSGIARSAVDAQHYLSLDNVLPVSRPVSLTPLIPSDPTPLSGNQLLMS